MQLNVEQIKQSACRILAVCDLIERSKTRELQIMTSEWYHVFGDVYQRDEDVAKQNKVTQRLYKYLGGLV